MKSDLERELFQEIIRNIRLEKMKNEKQNQYEQESIADSIERYDRSETGRIFAGFNSETQLEWLGGLRIWEFIAICFFTLLVIGKHYFSILRSLFL